MKKAAALALTTVLAASAAGCVTKEESPVGTSFYEAVPYETVVEKTYVYQTVTEAVTVGEGTAYELPGLLTLPEGVVSGLPAVVIVHGSGPSDMDGTAYAYKPYRDIAAYLASRGIAVLRYDKRTYVHAQKVIENSDDFTVYGETIEDAVYAANLLKGDTRIDPEKVFILGHSMGGMLAPRIDAEGGDFAGLILLAGSPRTFADIWHDQAVDSLEGLPVELISAGLSQIEYIMSEFEMLSGLTDEEAKAQYFLGGAFGGATNYYFKEWDSHPASAYLEGLTKPLLVMQGEADFQVYADKDFVLYKELLEGKANASFKLYPGLNHFFITSESGTQEEYMIEGKVDEGVLGDIADWIINGFN